GVRAGLFCGNFCFGIYCDIAKRYHDETALNHFYFPETSTTHRSSVRIARHIFLDLVSSASTGFEMSSAMDRFKTALVAAGRTFEEVKGTPDSLKDGLILEIMGNTTSIADRGSIITAWAASQTAPAGPLWGSTGLSGSSSRISDIGTLQQEIRDLRQIIEDNIPILEEPNVVRRARQAIRRWMPERVIYYWDIAFRPITWVILKVLFALVFLLSIAANIYQFTSNNPSSSPSTNNTTNNTKID
ncbi:hypothetical protein PROFUN_14850, partial [Planoprotostelium fungivorum]